MCLCRNRGLLSVRLSIHPSVRHATFGVRLLLATAAAAASGQYNEQTTAGIRHNATPVPTVFDITDHPIHSTSNMCCTAAVICFLCVSMPSDETSTTPTWCPPCCRQVTRHLMASIYCRYDLASCVIALLQLLVQQTATRRCRSRRVG